MTAAEAALERQISATIMRGGARPEIRRLRKGTVLAEQGQPGREIYLLLDGVLAVSVDGTQMVELGPGAIMGERAVLEQGLRTATLRAATDCVVAATGSASVDLDKLRDLERLHHREENDRQAAG
jgi:CRP-like cAMP-binding protein